MRILTLLLLASLSCPALAQVLMPLEELEALPPVLSLQKALANPDKVVKLDLTNQELDYVPEQLAKLKNLQYLSLHYITCRPCRLCCLSLRICRCCI